MTTARSLPLYWRVFLTNGVVFVGGTVALVLSPATVSADLLMSEIIVLTIGLTLILVTNALLLRRSLAPLDRLSRTMGSVDMLQPGQRVPLEGTGPVGHLIASFNAMLARLEAERSTSTARALAAQEGERQRIARELHDEVGQGLTVVLLGLKRAMDRAPENLREDLRSVQESARASLDEVRQVARRLRPDVLEDLGLLSALTALTSDFSEHGRVHVQRRLEPGLPHLDVETELVVYRVAQEALTNVTRHARAATVELALTRQADGIELLVADDGQGTRGAQEGAGIRGMRERALLAGGRLTVRPRTGGGTEVHLRVPVRPRP